MGIFNRKKGLTDQEKSILTSKNVERPEETFTLYDDMSGFKVGKGGGEGGNRSLFELVNKLRSETDERKDRFDQYKQALKDPVIGQAVEMMADDATQFDVDRVKTVWIESKDKEYEKEVNDMLKAYIEPFIDTVASKIFSHGEFVFRKGDVDTRNKEGKLVDVPLIPYKKLERVNHLIMSDQQHYYYVGDTDKMGSQERKDIDQYFFDQNEFVHFVNNSIDNSKEIELKLPTSVSSNQKTQKVFVLQGESIITDKVLETYKILRMLENGVIVSRLSKSKIVRFVKVNVSRLSSDEKAKNLVNYIHSAIVENERHSQNTYESTQLQAEPVVVTIPVKEGVGDITVEEFTTNADIKDIADLEYFRDKLHAGLRTPATYFNYKESFPGPASGASLAKTDIRYSRGVKKGQRVLVKGVESYVDLINRLSGIEEPPEYKVKIVKVASAEDEERYTEMDERIRLAQSVVDAVYAQPMDASGFDKKKADMYAKFFREVVEIPKLADFYQDMAVGKNIQSKPKEVKFKNEGVGNG